MLIEYKHGFKESNLRADSSSNQNIEQFDGSFSSTVVKGTLEENIYSAFGMVVPFITAFIDEYTAYSDRPKLSTVQRMCTDFFTILCSNCAV